MDEREVFQDADSMSDWSGSITPPAMQDSGDEIEQSQCVVPLKLRKENLPRPPLEALVLSLPDSFPVFSCGNLDFNQKGFLSSGLLQKIFDKQGLYPRYFKGTWLKLFGVKFTIKEGLLQPYRRKLFLLFRQHVNKLIHFANNKHSQNQDLDLSTNMQDYVVFLIYIQEMLYRMNYQRMTDCKIAKIIDYKNLTYSMLQELKAVLSSIGRVNNISPINRPFESPIVLQEKNIDTYLSHFVFDVSWYYVIILSQLCLRDNVDLTTRNECISLLEERCLNIIWDLVTVASKTFNKVWYMRDDESSYFPCPCCKEMWILLIRLLDGLAAKTTCQAFWTLYSSVSSSFLAITSQSSSENDSSGQQAYQQTNCKDPILFSWWLLRGIAPLYWYDNTGNRNFKEGMYLPGNWLHVQDLLRASFKTKNSTTDEKLARASIRCCLKLATIWNSSSDVIAFLWDFFHKRLNERFLVAVDGVLNSTVPCITSLQWMEKCNSLANQDINRKDEITTSFELFLQLLALGLTKTSKRVPQSQFWGQMKGRFYSKFHKKRMEDLNDIGLQNFISLFLVLELCIENEDIAQKMCSFLSLIHPSKRTLSMSNNLQKGLFAMHHVQRRKNSSTLLLTQKLKMEFQDSCREFAERQKDPINRRNIWQLINLYFKNVEEIYKNENGLESEAIFIQIGDSLSLILSNCSDSEARRVLSFVYCLLSSPRLHTGSGVSMLVDSRAVWSSLYLSMLKSWNDKQLLQQYPESFADVFAGFTLFSIVSNDANQKTDFKALFSKFCTSDAPARFNAKYLCHLLNSTAGVEKIVFEDQQHLVINSWFKCILNLTDKNELVIELSRKVSNLPEVSCLVGRQNSTQPIEKLAFSFIVALGNKILSTNVLAEMINLRKQASAYFGNILKYTESFLQTGNPVDCLRLSYSVIGKIMKHCSKIIYSKTSPDCLLPKILDQMVLPLQSNKKMVPASVTNCLLGHIHQFLSGLAILDFKRDEYVRRKIKEIFNRYFLVTTKRCNASPASKNPFLVVLHNTMVAEPTVGISDFRQFVVEIIAENFLVLPQPPENHSAALYFVHQLFQKTQSNAEIVRNSPALIMQIMCSLISCDACRGTSSEPPGIRKPAMEILTMITKANKIATVEARTKLQEQLQNVLMLNVPQFQVIVFKSFEALAKLDSKMAAVLVPAARESVEESERSRGCGEDKNLRRALDSFVCGIG